VVSGRRPPGRGGYIAFEGLDGSGKSTLRQASGEALFGTRDSYTMIGRHAWLDVASARALVALMDPGEPAPPASRIAEAFDIDANLLWTRVIEPALGVSHVLQDRSLLSEAAYNEILFGVPAEETIARHVRAGHYWPDVIVFLDVDPAEAYRRLSARGYGKDGETLDYLAAVDDVYRRLIENPTPGLPPIVTHANCSENWAIRLQSELVPRLRNYVPRMQARNGRGAKGGFSDGGVNPTQIAIYEALVTGRHVAQFVYHLDAWRPPSAWLRDPVPPLVELGGAAPYVQLARDVGVAPTSRDGVAGAADIVRTAAQAFFQHSARTELARLVVTDNHGQVPVPHAIGELGEVMAEATVYRWSGALLRQAGRLGPAERRSVAAVRAAARRRLLDVGPAFFELARSLPPVAVTRELLFLGHPFCEWPPFLARHAERTQEVRTRTPFGEMTVPMAAVDRVGVRERYEMGFWSATP
jgi:dTMP kinase